MKRRALLIGYTAEDSEEATLGGVRIDLNKYKNYLMSIRGGAWNSSEIITLEGPTKAELNRHIRNLIADEVDLAFTVFSGHGDFDDVEHQCRSFLLNKNEMFLEKDIAGIAKQQILICDSCANRRGESALESLQKVRNSLQSLIEEKNEEKIIARKKYEDWCRLSSPQIIRLYAAKVGTSADDRNGGVYTSSLIETLENAQHSIDIVEGHDNASRLVRMRTATRDGSSQVPERQVSRVSKFLPGAIVL